MVLREDARARADFVTIVRRRAGALRADARRRGRPGRGRLGPPRPPRPPAGDRPAPSPPSRHRAPRPRHARVRRPRGRSTRSGSSTFMLTWTIPRLGSPTPSARTPGKPPPFSRTIAAIARATSMSSVARFTLNATSGRRAPTSTAPTAGSSSAGPRSGASSPVDAAAAGPRVPPTGRTPGRGQRPARRREKPAGRAPRRALPPSSRPPSGPAPCPPARMRTSGTMSATPIRGWHPRAPAGRCARTRTPMPARRARSARPPGPRA